EHPGAGRSAGRGVKPKWVWIASRRNLHGTSAPSILDPSNHQIHELVHRHLRQPLRIERGIEDSLLLLRREASREIDAKLLEQQRNAFGAPAPMPDRILD